jgi:methylglutaconyl-CoA hydratase
MTDNIVELNISDNIARVTLNRPEVHNAFDENVIKRLSGIWDELASNNDLIAVILSGNGKNFSAGADLNWMKKAADYPTDKNEEDALALAEMLNKLYSLPMLTIGRITGAAMGGGFGLVSCLDVVFCEAGSKFALSEVKLGLIPATIAPYVINAIGERQARRYFQTAERFNAKKAKEIGLVHEVFDDADSLDQSINDLITNIKSNGPEAMRASKKLCADLSGKEITGELLADSAKRIAERRTSEEAKEGLCAFLDKRKAAWAQ